MITKDDNPRTVICESGLLHCGGARQLRWERLIGGGAKASSQGN